MKFLSKTILLSMCGIFSFFSNADADTKTITIVDDYLIKWDRFAQGDESLVPFLKKNKQQFEDELSKLLKQKDRRAPSRLVFYAVVQVGGFIPIESKLGQAFREGFEPSIKHHITEDKIKTFFAGDLYFWWLENKKKYEAFNLLDEWLKREFAKSVAIPMYQTIRASDK